MPARRPICIAAACAVVAVTVAGCSSGRPSGAGREGKPVNVAGLSYNVYITRELNLRDAADRGYYSGPEAPRWFAAYGLFPTVSNAANGFRQPPTDCTLEDNQGNPYHPH